MNGPSVTASLHNLYPLLNIIHILHISLIIDSVQSIVFNQARKDNKDDGHDDGADDKYILFIYVYAGKEAPAEETKQKTNQTIAGKASGKRPPIWVVALIGFRLEAGTLHPTIRCRYLSCLNANTPIKWMLHSNRIPSSLPCFFHPSGRWYSCRLANGSAKKEPFDWDVVILPSHLISMAFTCKLTVSVVCVRVPCAIWLCCIDKKKLTCSAHCGAMMMLR